MRGPRDRAADACIGSRSGLSRPHARLRAFPRALTAWRLALGRVAALGCSGSLGVHPLGLKPRSLFALRLRTGRLGTDGRRTGLRRQG
jgi:hypothetical protein